VVGPGHARRDPPLCRRHLMRAGSNSPGAHTGVVTETTVTVSAVKFVTKTSFLPES
jgi:hypothetical protein